MWGRSWWHYYRSWGFREGSHVCLRKRKAEKYIPTSQSFRGRTSGVHGNCSRLEMQDFYLLKKINYNGKSAVFGISCWGFVEYLTHPLGNIYSCTHIALSLFLLTVRLKCLNSVLTWYLYPSCFKLAPVTVQGPF